MIDLKDKKIAVLGLGIEGEDICRFLIEKKAREIVVFDKKNEGELGDLKEFRDLGINFVLGEGYLEKGLIGFDTIFRSPVFKPNLLEILKAQQKGAILLSATKVFFELFPGKIIGVTGTKGKGTTATLINQILKNAEKDVFLAGNIGSPMLSLLSKANKDSWAVLELSSFQLIDMNKSPHMAVVLNISVDHLDWHGDKDEYIRAKENIVRFQNENDFAILNADYETSQSFSKKTKAKIYYFSRKGKINGCFVRDGQVILNLDYEETVLATKDLKLRGEHNWENITAAILASRLAGAELSSIKKTVFSFVGLEHRLEFIKEENGVKFYNDSFSTTPETCIAAIQSFKEPIILIAGGSEKGSDYSELGKTISNSSVKTLILIGKMAPKIKESVEKAGRFKGKIIENLSKMEEIVKTSRLESTQGDVVLLSPACASFDMFRNYKDRGEQFKKWLV